MEMKSLGVERAPMKSLDAEFAGIETIDRGRGRLAAIADAVVAHHRENDPHRLDLRVLAGTQPEPPRFIVRDWLPEDSVTLFAGDGGTGKSLVALQLAVCIASGRPFFGMPVQRRRVGFLSFEDDENILHWRLSRVCAWLDVDMASLDDWLFVWDAVHAEAAMVSDATGELMLSPMFTWAMTATVERRVEVLMVDNASDAFDANENVRRMVRKFVRILRSLIPPGGALILLSHVDKLSAKTRDTTHGYSGSTAWSNSVRSRWYLRQEEDGLLLEVQKANHARAGASIRLRWNDSAHLFVSDQPAPTSYADRALADVDEREAIVAAMRACASSTPPIAVPAATTGQRTAYHVLSVRTEFPESLRHGKDGKRRFWQQIERLRAMGSVIEGEIRRADRHTVTVLALPSEERG